MSSPSASSRSAAWPKDLLLAPAFGLPDAAGPIIEMSFAGGHGTIAGMDQQAGEDGDRDRAETATDWAESDIVGGVTFVAIPFNAVGGFVVHLLLSWTTTSASSSVAPSPTSRTCSLDILVAAAIGTLSSAPWAQNIASIVILTALSVGWSVTGLLWLGPRFFTAHWFDRGIADYGQSQGNVATGFILTEMADPAHTTGAAMGYGYKQLFYEPFLGGGILTALSVPLILSIGSLTFGIASAAITTGLIICSVVRNRHASSKPVHDQSSKGPAHLINAPGFRSRSSGDRADKNPAPHRLCVTPDV